MTLSESSSMKEIVTAYNDAAKTLDESLVTKFATKATGLKRLSERIVTGKLLSINSCRVVS